MRETQSEYAVMRRTVVAVQTRAIHDEHHGKALETDVVNHLVEGALENVEYIAATGSSPASRDPRRR